MKKGRFGELVLIFIVGGIVTAVQQIISDKRAEEYLNELYEKDKKEREEADK